MYRQAEAFVTSLRGYKGYLEKETNANLESFTANAGDENFTLFGQWYDQFFNTKGFNGAAWCHDLPTYVAYKTGITPDQVPYTASCGTGVSWFKLRDRWHDRKGYTPKPGDYIYFHHGDFEAAHVGVVYAVTATTVFTIEGNTSGGSTLIENGGGVAEKSYSLSYVKILGYGSPLYKEDSEDEDMLTGKDIYERLTEYAKTLEVPEWAKKELAEAVTAGITDGTNPMMPIPRYQAAIMALRATKK